MSISSGIALVLGGAAASLAALAIAAGADAASRRDTRVLLVNDTDHALTRLYASPVGDSYYNGNATTATRSSTARWPRVSRC